jgi:predicted metal-dependent hydrolase
MTISAQRITVGGLVVEVVRKDIKNLHIGVYPPAGRVRVATPLAIGDDAVRLAIVEKLGWIKRQQRQFARQPRQAPREMVSGESHFFLGQRYRLQVRERAGPEGVGIRGLRAMDLFVRVGADLAQREAVLLAWYRAQLRILVASLLAKWQPVLGAQARLWGIKRMKTKWGSCNPQRGSIWLNLELAKKPVRCIEYIVVHELVHLLEPDHGDRFTALMDQFLPDWPRLRTELQNSMLGAEDWSY